MTSLAEGSPKRALLIGSGATVACSLPVFFTGALAVQLTRDLEFGTVGIGGAVAVFFGTMGLTSIHLGRLVDRLGAIISMRIATAMAAAAALAIALFARTWLTLAAFLFVAGLAAALAQPAANRLLMYRIRSARLGLAFGFKQSAPPVSSMLAGLSVPAIALTIGWRWAYALIAVVAVIAAIAVGPRPASSTRPGFRSSGGKREPLRNPGTLVVLAGGFGLAFVASTSVLAFFVDAAVFAGTRDSTAGLVFAAGSLAAITTRLAAGAAVDRFTFSPLRVSAALLGTGAVGIGLLATQQPTTMAFGAVIALLGTWGFPGLFWFALVSAYPDTPGRITGAMAPSALGGIFGPVGFGAIASNVGYSMAWGLAGILALLGALALLFGAHRLISETNDPDGPA